MKITIQSADNSIATIEQLIDFKELVSDTVKSHQAFKSFDQNYKYNDLEAITIKFDEEKVKLQKMKGLLDLYTIDTTKASQNTLEKYFTDIFKKLEEYKAPGQQPDNQFKPKVVPQNNRQQ